MTSDWKKAKHRQWSHEIQNVMRISNEIDKASDPISADSIERWTTAVYALGPEDLFSYTVMLAETSGIPDRMLGHFKCLCFYAYSFGLTSYAKSLYGRIAIMEEALAFWETDIG